MFKHLVLSGGGYLGYTELGALLHMEQLGLFNIEEIDTFDGTSVGAIFSVLFSLGTSAKDLTDYFVNRPWDAVFKDSFPNLSLEEITKIGKEGGILKNDFIKNILSPYLHVHFAESDIENITLEDLYLLTKKEVYVYTVKMNTDTNNITLVQLNHKTHPQMSVITALQMSCALPILFKPVKYEDNYYLDGGILSNYPLQQVLEREETEPNNILGIELRPKINRIKNSSFFIADLQISLLSQLVSQIRKTYEVQEKKIKYEMPIITNNINVQDIHTYLCSKDAREELIEKGKESAIVFCRYTDLYRE
jgi:NTE family protein